MAKKKLKKNKTLRKQSQRKQRKQQKEEKRELPEVDKELYEIQISDLKSKLQRSKERYSELEKDNVKIKEDATQLHEDRGDVIAYLKSLLHSATDEVYELRERVTALQQTREEENCESMGKLNNKELELQKLQERLTTEINLLNGKLNVMEEFRAQKDELMKKFQSQEKAQKQQEFRHQEALHNIEKDFILKKIRMKKEVEEKLIKLSEDFQKIMQSKIDSTTKTKFFENNALKVEMKNLMETCKELIQENENLTNNERTIKIKYSLINDELEHSIKKYLHDNKKLQKVLVENTTLKREVDSHVNKYGNQIQFITNNYEQCKNNLYDQIQLNEDLKQRILSLKEHERIQNKKVEDAVSRNEKLEFVLRNAVSIIKKVALIPQDEDNENVHYNRMMFASSLLDVLKAVKIENEKNIFPDKFVKF